ncbi:hypothetical protein E4U15_002372 [Claviceps sp. LM218 group G6]|nr:hypothetical protein E4U15_002372 [Claviceps sp. LM218 group G6]
MPTQPGPTGESLIVSIYGTGEDLSQHVDDVLPSTTPTRESVTIVRPASFTIVRPVDDTEEDTPCYISFVYEAMYEMLEENWRVILHRAHGDEFPEIDDCFTAPIGFLRAFSEACERRWANEPPAEPYLRGEFLFFEAASYLYDYTGSDEEAEELEMVEARTKIFVILDGFWSRILQQPQRREEMTMTTFDMVWQLLERQKQMAQAGEGHAARIDRLLDLLLQEEFASLFPMVLTNDQWDEIFLADFDVEDCKMLYVIEMEYCFIVQVPVYRAA